MLATVRQPQQQRLVQPLLQPSLLLQRQWTLLTLPWVMLTQKHCP
jgi:hypothetical protein